MIGEKKRDIQRLKWKMVCRKIIFEDVMAENFLVFMKDRSPSI